MELAPVHYCARDNSLRRALIKMSARSAARSELVRRPPSGPRIMTATEDEEDDDY